VLGVANILLTLLAYMHPDSTFFSYFGAVWMLACVPPTLLITLGFAVRDSLQRKTRLQAVVAVLLSAPSAIWLFSIRL
jgi:hypothetical protein